MIGNQDRNPGDAAVEGKSNNWCIITIRGEQNIMLCERSQVQNNACCVLLKVKFKKE